jgi:hypothetical protein
VQAATVLVDLQGPLSDAEANVDRQLKAMRDGSAIRASLETNPRLKLELAKNRPAANAALGRVGAMQADALGPILREMPAATRQAAIRAYAGRFTVAELEALAAFYRSPAGAKLARLQPEISREVGREVGQRFQSRLQAAEKVLQPKIAAELKAAFPQPAEKAR